MGAKEEKKIPSQVVSGNRRPRPRRRQSVVLALLGHPYFRCRLRVPPLPRHAPLGIVVVSQGHEYGGGGCLAVLRGGVVSGSCSMGKVVRASIPEGYRGHLLSDSTEQLLDISRDLTHGQIVHFRVVSKGMRRFILCQREIRALNNQMSSPILPLELCELVIDLIDDLDALRAFSLACKAFLPACRRHLFYYVCLSNRHIAKRFLRSICSMPSSTSPYRHIHHLRLRDDFQWVNDALPLLATLLLDVTILELQSVKWTMLDQTGQASLVSGFQKVKRLETLYGAFDTSEQMSQFIASFPLLVELSCTQTYWRNDTPTRTAFLTPLPHGIHTITLAACQSRFFHQLLTLESPPCVRSVSFQHMGSEHLDGVSMFLEALGSNLEELDLGEVPNALRGRYQRPKEGQPCCHLPGNFHVISNSFISVVLRINLSHNTHLRYIHVNIFGLYGTGSMEWLTALFSQVLSPHVVHISLSFRIADLSTLGGVDWAEIEREFTQPRWINLQRLALFWCGPSEITSAAMDAITTRLPLLESRGVLCFFSQFNSATIP